MPSTTLLVGFDSAWTQHHRGALVGALQSPDGRLHELTQPQAASFPEAELQIRAWQTAHAPTATLVMLDQPTVVTNDRGQRPVENIACGSVSRRRGGMQPANTARVGMFSATAPVWPFLAAFGGAADPEAPMRDTRVIETYPVLGLIALHWLCPDTRPCGRLPKYNPGRRATFSRSDWCLVTARLAAEFGGLGMRMLADWCHSMAELQQPRKPEQDQIDAALCLLFAIRFAAGKPCLCIGELATGYIVVPHDGGLAQELAARCESSGRTASQWVRRITARRPD